MGLLLYVEGVMYVEREKGEKLPTRKRAKGKQPETNTQHEVGEELGESTGLSKRINSLESMVLACS